MELSDSGTESLKLMIIQLIQNQKLNNIRDRDMNGHVDKSHMSGCQSNEKLMPFSVQLSLLCFVYVDLLLANTAVIIVLPLYEKLPYFQRHD